MNDSSFENLKAHITQLASDVRFRHHDWFITYHLEIVEKITLELCDIYPEADKNICRVMAWMHDYGKIIDFDTQYATKHAVAGKSKMIEMGFAPDFADKVTSSIEWMDKRSEVDLHDAPIEVRIVSTADGCSHFASPFHYTYWHENPGKSTAEIIEGKKERIRIDWEDKIVLPEAKAAFEPFYNVTCVQNGQLPESYIIR